ncbi:MAG: hypothetical protein ABIH23_28710 [bacterium]
MITLLGLFNGLLTGLFDIVFWPFRALDPIWAMVFVSLVTGVLMVWMFGKMSDQRSVKRVKDRIRGNLIAVRLYQNDIRVVFRLQGRILRDTLTYMKYSVIPMLVMMVPVVLIMIQLNLRFSVRPLQEGRQTLVIAKVRDASVLNDTIVLKSSEGVAIETSGVRIKSEREIAWRIRAEKPGQYSLVVETGNESVEKNLIVGEGWGSVSALRTGNNLLDVVLYPGEKPIKSSSPVESIEIKYQALSMPVFGWNIHWLVLFFVLSIVFGFALKGPLGVEV